MKLLSAARAVDAALRSRAAKPMLFALLLGPAAWLMWGAVHGLLGANPAERIIRDTGEWTLRLLTATLAVTPLRTWARLPSLLRLRRMLGVFTFAYALLHLLSFAWLDMGLDLAAIIRDIGKRPFILVGTLALLLMTPLAATSSNAAVRWLGARRWQTLHRLVYVIAALALLHFFWMRAGKNDFAEWMVYATVMAVLLAARLVQPRRHTG